MRGSVEATRGIHDPEPGVRVSPPLVRPLSSSGPGFGFFVPKTRVRISLGVVG